MYVTADQLRARLRLTSTDSDDLLWQSAQWATAWIDAYCGRTFEAQWSSKFYDAAAVDPNNSRLLHLDADLVQVGGITNGDGTALAGSTYFLYPRGQSPAWGILLKPDYAWQFDSASVAAGYVEVAGAWGYSLAPDDLIVGCCLRLAEWHFRSKDLIDVATPFTESVSTKTAPGFPLEVAQSLEGRRRL